MEQDNTYYERLEKHLLEVCTSQGLLKGVLLSSEDIDEAWVRLGPPYYGDAVRQFNDYPEFSLACAGYLGMAVAVLWEQDWEKWHDVPYSYFLGDRGFDNMDDHITDSVLKESKHSEEAMQTVSAEALHFLMHESVEPGTAEAYRLFLLTCECVYKTGAAIELHQMGYKFQKL